MNGQTPLPEPESVSEYQSIFLGHTTMTKLRRVEHLDKQSVVELLRLTVEPPKMPVHKLLQRYRELSRNVLELYWAVVDLHNHLLAENAFLAGGDPAGHRKRWTDDDDEALIELSCQDDTNMITLARSLNRTPAAISSRLTYLVGIRRLSRQVVGHLTGYLDGEPVDGFVVGEVEEARR